jgi:hypothetical protein
MILPAGKFILQIFGALTASMAMALAVFAWLLSSGPVSLGFLTPYLKEALTLGRAGVQVEMDDTILTWAGWDRTLDVRAIGVRLLDTKGKAIARVPEISLGLSGAALMDGRVVPTTLDLLRPQVRLLRTKDGRFDLGLGSRIGSATGDAAATFFEALLNPSFKDRRDGFLSRISVLNADILLVDHASRTTWRAPWADISLLRSANGIDGNIIADVEIGGDATRISAVANYHNIEQKLDVSLDLADFLPAELAAHIPALDALKAFSAPISGKVSTTLYLDGKAAPVEFNLTGGPGVVTLPDFFAGSLVFSQLAAQGVVREDYRSIEFGEIVVDTGGPSGVARGNVKLVRKGDAWAAGGTLEGTLRDVPMADLGEYWPPKLAHIARDWVLTNIKEGHVREGNFILRINPEDFENETLPKDALDLALRFENLTTRYLPELPPLLKASGTARMTVDTLDISVEAGHVNTLQLSEGSVLLSDLSGDNPAVDISFVVSGPVKDGMAVLDMEPFGFATLLGVVPAELGGEMAARARIALPLSEDIDEKDVRFAAAANVRDFSMPKGIGGVPLNNGTLAVSIDANAIDITGDVVVAGVKANIAWRQGYYGEAAKTSQLRMTTVLDEAGRKGLGLPDVTWLAGPVGITADLVAENWQISRGTIAVDLTSAAIAMPELMWRKDAGVPGHLDFQFVLPDDPAAKVQAQTQTKADSSPAIGGDFSYAGGGLEASGNLELGAGAALKQLNLSKLKFGLSDVSASIRPLAPEGYIVAMEGTQFDMRPYMARLLGDDANKAGGDLPPLRLQTRLRRLIVDDTQMLDNMEGGAEFDGTVWRTLNANGDLSRGDLVGGVPVVVSYSSNADKSRIRVRSNDGGGVVRKLGIFENAFGGELALDATIFEAEKDRPMRGKVTLKQFKVVDAPTLSNILTVGSLSGVANILTNNGIPFVQFEAPFLMKNGVITTRDARAFGPSLGVTIEGIVDRNKSHIELQGTLVPAYTINSVLGNIPILGRLLIGGEGQGIFGLTYKVSGAISRPQVLVNPLSALAPGPLRTLLFGGFPTNGETTEQPDSGQDN